MRSAILLGNSALHEPDHRALSDALLRAARRGVRVRLLLDGVGAFLLSRLLTRELTRSGVELACLFRSAGDLGTPAD